MKLYLPVLLACCAVSVLGGDKEYHKLKKWAMMKAMEGCFGPEVMKQYMVKVKTSAAKCMKVDAPQLDLPMFQNSYRVVGALVDGAYNPSHTHAFGGLDHHPHPHGHDGPNRGPHHHGRPAGGSYGQGGQSGGWMEDVMKKVFFQKMLEMFLEDEFDSGSDSGDADMMDGMSSMNGGGNGRRAIMKFFAKQQGARRTGGGRWKRQADSNTENKKQMFELGDRLNAKLQQAQDQMEAQIGNYTCMLRECGVIDASNQLVSVEQLQKGMEEFPIRDQWLKDNIMHDIEICHAFATAVPEKVLEDCTYGPEIGRVKMYKKCLKMHKMRTCMNHDVKQQLEANFGGSLEDLVETTQMEEDDLLPLVMTLLQGPEVNL